jgi:hypothetical protein
LATIADTDDQQRGMGLQDVARKASDQASETRGGFQVDVRGTMSKLNNDFMEKMQILMTASAQSFSVMWMRESDSRRATQ